VVGTILVDAIEASPTGTSAHDAALEIAFNKGRSLGEDVKAAARLRDPGSERALNIAERVLEKSGYEPYRDETNAVRLRNCPFHTLSRRSPELVCGLNRAFVDGLLRGLGNETAPGRVLRATYVFRWVGIP
jgi:predicted ArsR family transcriptional regulator